MNLLEIENLSFAYENLRRKSPNYVLNNINLHIKEGENVGLIGENGAGKSTFLKILTGLLDMQEGKVQLSSLELKKENLRKIRTEIGYVFQDSDSQLFMSTVYEDVAFAPRNYGKDESGVQEAVTSALRQVHMEDKKDRQIYRLSGGEKKLAAIATVLAVGTRLMLLDEPSAALDPKNRRNLIRILNELPCAKLIASHDLDFVYDTCQRVILLSGGEIAADGDAEKILTDRELLEGHGLELPLSFSRERGYMGLGTENSHRFFENRNCEYFPCHKEAGVLNCMFCYCPLYLKEKCPGIPSYIEKNGRRIKDCSNCTFPHQPENYDTIIRILKE